MTSVSDAVSRRMSVRAFLPDCPPPDVIKDLVRRAARAPSGGNLQPWHVEVLTGEPLVGLLEAVRRRAPDPLPGYTVYPNKLWEPYRSRRFENAEALYSTLSIAREDKAARLGQLARNAEQLGAPVGVFLFIDRRMGPPQWADIGMYLQTLMLLAVEKGIDTCPQDFWSLYAHSVERFLDMPEQLMLFCGLALGYRDRDAPINTLATSRAPTDEWLRLRGF